jgi:hypothetical protein
MSVGKKMGEGLIEWKGKEDNTQYKTNFLIKTPIKIQHCLAMQKRIINYENGDKRALTQNQKNK